MRRLHRVDYRLLNGTLFVAAAEKNKDSTYLICGIILSARIEPQLHIEGDGTHCGNTAKGLPCRQWSFVCFTVRLPEGALYWLVLRQQCCGFGQTYTYCCRSGTCNIVGFTRYICSVWLRWPWPSVTDLQRLQLGFHFTRRSCSRVDLQIAFSESVTDLGLLIIEVIVKNFRL